MRSNDLRKCSKSGTSSTTGGTLFNGTLLGTSVQYNGNWAGGQLTGSGGTNFYAPNAPYTQGGLTSPDAGNNYGFIQFIQPSTGVFTFGTALTDVYVALISVGQPGTPVSYTFDRAFTVVSNNNSPNCAFWGCGSYTLSGNTITGTEFSGTLLFQGSTSSLTMTTDPSENWHGATIGAAVVATPEPATLWLVGSGLLGLAGFAKRRARNA